MANATGIDSGKRMMIGIHELSPGLNARKHFDELKQKELEKSIKEIGVVQDLTVRPDADGFEIVCGERRFRAAQKAGVKELNCVVRKLTDEEAVQIGLIDNNDRDDVHPMDEAEYYGMLIEKHGYTVKKISELLKSKSVQYVANRLQLLKLIKPAKEKLWKGEMELGHALVICQVPAEEQKGLLECTEHDNWDYKSPKELQEYVKTDIMRKLKGVRWDLEDAELLPDAGACSACAKRTGANTDLFGDGGTNDRCMDGECFAKKLAAFKEKKLAELKAAGHAVYAISESSYTRGTGLMDANKWEKAKTTDADGYGIIGDGEKEGDYFPIKLKGSAAVKAKTAPPAEIKKRQEERAKAKAEKMEEDARTKALHAGITEVLGKVSGEWSTAALRMVADAMQATSGTSTEEDDLIAAAMKLKRMPRSDKDIEKLSRKQLLIMSLGFGLIEEIDNGGEDVVEAVCKSYGVDIAKLTKNAVKEIAAGKQAEQEAKEKGAAEEKSAAAAETEAAKKHSESAGTIGGVGVKKGKKRLVSPMTKAIHAEKAAKKNAASKKPAKKKATKKKPKKGKK